MAFVFTWLIWRRIKNLKYANKEALAGWVEFTNFGGTEYDTGDQPSTPDMSEDITSHLTEMYHRLLTSRGFSFTL